MYANPSHIRDHVVKVRLNDDEYQLLEALSQYSKNQKAVLAREFVLSAMAQLTGQQTTNESRAA